MMGDLRLPAEYVLGVDGGGTWTRCSVIRLDGVLVASGEAGPSNPVTAGVKEAYGNIMEAVNEASGKCGVHDFKVSVLGVAGADRSRLKGVLLRMLPERLGEAEMVSDAKSALAGATAGQPGVIVISGTGSIVYGENPAGGVAQAGGWGWRLGDEGSGYNIGKGAIISALKAHDGRGRATKLTDLLVEKLELDRLEDVIDWAYDPGRRPRDFAALVPLVRKAHREGDEEAGMVLAEAGSELGLVARAVIKRLALRNGFPVAFNGGLFQEAGPYTIALEEVIRREAAECVFISPRFRPDVGSGLLALKKSGVAVDEEILRRLEASVGKDDD